MPSDAVREALADLEVAIITEGRIPKYHREVMARHRKEWPTLWRAIDKLRKLISDKEPFRMTFIVLYLDPVHYGPMATTVSANAHHTAAAAFRLAHPEIDGITIISLDGLESLSQ